VDTAVATLRRRSASGSRQPAQAFSLLLQLGQVRCVVGIESGSGAFLRTYGSKLSRANKKIYRSVHTSRNDGGRMRESQSLTDVWSSISGSGNQTSTSLVSTARLLSDIFDLSIH